MGCIQAWLLVCWHGWGWGLEGSQKSRLTQSLLLQLGLSLQILHHLLQCVCGSLACLWISIQISSYIPSPTNKMESQGKPCGVIARRQEAISVPASIFASLLSRGHIHNPDPVHKSQPKNSPHSFSSKTTKHFLRTVENVLDKILPSHRYFPSPHSPSLWYLVLTGHLT